MKTYFWISYNHTCLSKQSQMTRDAGRDNEDKQGRLKSWKAHLKGTNDHCLVSTEDK